MKVSGHRQARLRARQRVNSRNYRRRHPKRGPERWVLRMGVEPERARRLARLAKDATRNQIEQGWADLVGKLVDDLEAGKLFRHR